MGGKGTPHGIGIILGILLLAASAWGSTLQHRALALASITPAQEASAGRAAAAAVETRFARLNDPLRLRRVRTVVHRLEAAAGKKPGTFTVRLLDSSDFNALSLPGNYIYVMRGLVDGVNNNDELAAALAHEMSHTFLGHTRELLQDPPARKLAVVVDSRQPDGSIRRNVVVRDGISDRQKELDADRAALPLMQKAGYNPEAAIGMLEHLVVREAYQHAPEPAGDTHPPATERIHRIAEYLNVKVPADGELTAGL